MMMENKIIFETTDVFNQKVFLYEEELKHIESGHPELKEQTELIKETISKPEFVYESKDYPNRSIFWKKGGHSKYCNLYAEAVVEYDNSNVGNVTTAFLSNSIKGVREGGLKYVSFNNKLR